MRKLFPLFLLLFANTILRAYDFRGGDLYYNITSQTAPYTVEVTYQEEYYSDDNYAGLTTATIPETVIYNDITYSVTSIGGDAFRYCSSLTSVTIPNSVMRIGAGAFDGTGIYYDESNWDNNVLYIDNCLIKTYSISGSYTIKENTRLIADYAFQGCRSLISITIPNSVMSIGKEAFSNCSSITSITIPSCVRSIGDCAFVGCFSFTSIVVENGNTAYDSRENCNAIIETATNTLIAGCQNTFIPNSVTSIGNGAFEFCTSLTSITIPSSVTSIGRGAFASCSSLTSLTIPNSITSIEQYAFNECTSLTSITIPYNVTSIGYHAFYGTGIYNDESNWENNVLYIDNCLICANTSISSLYTIKENTRLIADYAFDWCSSLTSITIPNSVTSIGNSAFRACSSLADVICKSIEMPMLELDVFVGMPISEATLYVPVQSLENYKAAAQWKEFGSIVPLEETPNAVDNILSSLINTHKILRNGQLLILRDGKTYTVMGQEL